MSDNILISGTQTLGAVMDSRKADKFEEYHTFLEEKNKVMNLTAVTGWDETVKLHFLDCIAIGKYADFNGKSVIDIGSGAGFPGVPLKIINDEMKLTLLDALQKRVDFLGELCEKLELSFVNCVHARAEEEALKPEMRDSFDYAISRAVARLSMLCELCMPFIKVGGAFLAMKSVEANEEIKEAENAIKKLGGKIEKIEDYTIPGTDIIHRVVIIRKLSPTPTGFPRRFAKIQKKPL